MPHLKEARLTLAGAELQAVEATGVSFQDALRAAVEDLMTNADDPFEESSPVVEEESGVEEEATEEEPAVEGGQPEEEVSE